ncbi:MAG TPA: hypothetical protein VF813_10330 [Anaerolineaceae bacterium]
MEDAAAGQVIEREVFTEIQGMLTELYEAYRAKSGRRRISDNSFARWLGVSPSNWNYWINGSRLPELKNALILAPRIEELLGAEKRVAFMETLGYPNYQQIRDSRLQVIVGAWEANLLPRSLKEELYNAVMEEKSWEGKPRPDGQSK